MHARVMIGLMQPDKIEEGETIYRDSIVPAAKEQKGLKEILLLVAPETGKWISITLWETEADMLAGEASGYLREQVAKAAGTLTGAPSREAFEVRVKA